MKKLQILLVLFSLLLLTTEANIIENIEKKIQEQLPEAENAVVTEIARELGKDPKK